MKSRKLLLISVVIFGLLLGGVAILQTRASVVDVTARITPPFNSMEDPIPEYLTITLSDFPNPYKPEDVDPDSIIIGGVEELGMAVIEDWPKIGRKTFRFKVVGEELYYWVVLPYIWHNGYPPLTRVEIPITVEGQLFTSDAFQGTCTLTVFTEKIDEDPLPNPG